MFDFEQISTLLQAGKVKDVQRLVQEALDAGAPAKDILNQGLLRGMSAVGDKFKTGEVFIPEVLAAARAMNLGVQVLKPHLQDGSVQAAGRVAIGTVEGDLHDIGKNLVKLMMEGKGIEVVDLGANVPAARFVEAVREQNCNLVACSALLTTTMDKMGEIVEALKEAGLRDRVTILIGGAPITQAFCDKIGADVYTVDAASAAEEAVKACQKA